MSLKITHLVILSSLFIAPMGYLYAQDQEYSEELKQHLKDVEETQALSKQGKEDAAKKNDQEWIAIWANVDPLYERKSACFNNNDEIGIRVCILKSYEELAEQGNFVAQDFLAQLYLGSHENKAVALKWMQTAYNNPKTPEAYKTLIKEALDPLEKEMKDKKESLKGDSKYSERAQKHQEAVKENLEYVKVEKRKAELLKVTENLVLLEAAEAAFISEQACYSQPTENQMEVCYLESVKKLAEGGNFYSQHQLGNIYENSFKNNAQAIKWYEAALNNPKTPESYKGEVIKDLTRAKESK